MSRSDLFQARRRRQLEMTRSSI